MTRSAGGRVGGIGDDESARFAEILQGYGGIRAFGSEAGTVAAVVRELCPSARSLLDVGCGCGFHLSHFSGMFDHVEGVDLSHAMVTSARRRNPSVTIHQGDMRTIRMDGKFDCVVSLSASIPAMLTADDLVGAIGNISSFLSGRGVLVVQAFPDGALPPKHQHVASDGVTTVVRIQDFVPDDADPTIIVNNVEYRVEGGGSDTTRTGPQVYREVFLWKMWTAAEYRRVIEDTGLSFLQLPAPGYGGPLYVGIRR